MVSFEVVRSPARVCWWVMVNGVRVDTADTKALAQEKLSSYKKLLA